MPINKYSKSKKEIFTRYLYYYKDKIKEKGVLEKNYYYLEILY